MKKVVIKIVSWFVLVIFLIGVAPKEYLHDILFHHVDTVDSVYKKGEVVITVKHIHCSFLGFVFAPFVAKEKQFISFNEIADYTNYVAVFYFYNYTSDHEVVSLRGPPQDC